MQEQILCGQTIDAWMQALTQCLKDCFLERLLFVGLQGSYQRNEATVKSDVDIVLILDMVTPGDLEAYRAILADLPGGELACGFVGSREILMHWPRHELFQFVKDTRAYYGDLDALIQSPTRAEVVAGVRIGAANLYHEVAHRMLFASQDVEALYSAYKGAFFLLQSLEYLRSGVYATAKQALLPRLNGVERKILEIGMHWEDYAKQREQNPEDFFSRLFLWSASLLGQKVQEEAG